MNTRDGPAVAAQQGFLAAAGPAEPGTLVAIVGVETCPVNAHEHHLESIEHFARFCDDAADRISIFRHYTPHGSARGSTKGRPLRDARGGEVDRLHGANGWADKVNPVRPR